MTADPLLHVPFADSLEAAEAGGNPEAVVDPDGAEPAFEDDGVRPGARFARDSCVYYETEGNVNQDAGTVMTWFKPGWAADFEDDLGRIIWDVRIDEFHHGGDEPDPSGRFALVYPAPPARDLDSRDADTVDRWRFCVATDRNRYRIGTTRERPDERSRQAVYGSKQTFDAGEWMHLAVTWTVTEGAVFVNGREDGREVLANGLPDEPLPEYMQIGATPTWMNAGAEGVLADLRVYGEALDENAVAAAAGMND